MTHSGQAQSTDVLVIGGGIVGVCTTLYLARQGVDVTLVEKDQLAAGSSYGNAGLLVPSHSVPLAEPAAIQHGLRWMLNPASPFYIKPRFDLDLARWLWRFWRAATPERVQAAIPILRDLHMTSRALYEEMVADGLDFGYERRGRILLCDTQAGFADACHEAEEMGAAGIPTQQLDPAACARHLDGLACQVVGGLLYPDDAHLDPARCVAALATAASEAGAHIVENAAVTGWQVARNRIDTVSTSQGTYQPQQIVLASGSWSPSVARGLGLTIPIQPAKGYSVTVEAPADTPRVPFMLTEAKVAVTPLSGPGDTRRVRFAGTLELAGMDLSLNTRRVDALTAAVPRYLPSWDPDHFVVEEVWGGLRPCTPDGLPMLGRTRRWQNLVLAAGHAMIGISLGAVTGQTAARLVMGSTIDHDLHLLDPDRFG
ncbi:MAG: FAD-dependent oxidoreductase [Gemmatimonadetes bacterium]|jgi:D-amino-acid dehydrogenase|nr:FAD-dependent oxidoreductase [Gemmatimonadota bacterium]MBT6147369.1 FAD-dependent oxidoreductase [Gemmatimonadota bacterium]MBT7859356.1 FAD-dependent oxidoreductase [Gemmatimonadota bacterium]